MLDSDSEPRDIRHRDKPDNIIGPRMMLTVFRRLITPLRKDAFARKSYHYENAIYRQVFSSFPVLDRLI